MAYLADAFDSRPSNPGGHAARLGGQVPIRLPLQAGQVIDPGQRLATAKQKLDQAVADLKAASKATPPPTAEQLKAQVSAVDAAAKEYRQAIHDAYGVTLQENVSSPGVTTAQLDMSHASTANAKSALATAQQVQTTLERYGEAFDQMSTWLSKAKGASWQGDKYSLFQKVMGNVTVVLTDSPPAAAKDAKGYTSGQTIYDSVKKYETAMTPQNLVHEMMHVLMFRAGGGSAYQSGLVKKLGEGTQLQTAEGSMKAADQEHADEAAKLSPKRKTLRQDDADPASKTEAAADLMLYFTQGWLPEGDYQSTIDEMLNAAMGQPASGPKPS